MNTSQKAACVAPSGLTATKSADHVKALAARLMTAAGCEMAERDNALGEYRLRPETGVTSGVRTCDEIMLRRRL